MSKQIIINSAAGRMIHGQAKSGKKQKENQPT
jgi:hypothetical protein